MIHVSGPSFKELVLVGGGHAHIQVIKALFMHKKPGGALEGLRVTLVSDVYHAPYSGMLPGLIAGHYSFHEAHINLERLARACNTRFIHAAIAGLDADKKQLFFKDKRPALDFDILSLNLGSTPDFDMVTKGREKIIPIKPVQKFLDWWYALQEQIGPSPRFSIVGAGAGGLELALSIHFRLQQQGHKAKITLVAGRDGLLANHSRRLAQHFEALLQKRGIRLLKGARAVGIEEQKLVLENGIKFEADHVIWAGHAKAATWLPKSGLKLDQKGFIAVNNYLQSCSHRDIFAVGDCASLEHCPGPKSGVFAVRQGPVLAQSIRRKLLGKMLRAYKPQNWFLSLISTGDKIGYISYAGISLGGNRFLGKRIWYWKDKIDRRFMAQFVPKTIPTPKPIALAPKNIPQIRCLGCGGKLAPTILAKSLVSLGLEDKAQDTQTIPGGEYVQSSDLLSAPISDPYLAGKIITTHALSDIYASGTNALAAQVLAGIPFGSDKAMGNDLRALLAGAQKVLEESKAKLIGGHSYESNELALGLTVTGRASLQSFQKDCLKGNETLFITKPLGTGVILAAAMRLESITTETLVTNMLVSNRKASLLAQECAIKAVTDITGFGLVGHLAEMLTQSSCGATLDLDDIPLLDGALELSTKGIRSSLFAQNCRFSGFNPDTIRPLEALLFDPQTSGGLLIAVPHDTVKRFMAKAAQSKQPLWRIGTTFRKSETEDWQIRFI